MVADCRRRRQRPVDLCRHHPAAAGRAERTLHLSWSPIRDPILDWSRPSPVARSGHTVADPAYGEDVAAVGGVIAELAAEPFHIGANQLRVAGFVSAPYLAQQRIVAEDPSRVDRQGFEQIEFSGRQLQWSPGHGDPASLVVDGQVPHPEGVGRALQICAGPPGLWLPAP